MDDRLRESISALMDDESNELELQRILAHSDSEGVQAVWARYHEVRRVIKQDSDGQLKIDVSAGVAAAIRNEASIGRDTFSRESESVESPNATQSVTFIDAKKTADDSRRRASLGGRAWLALAASVAFAFVFTLQGDDEQVIDQLPTVAASSPPESLLLKVGSSDEPKIIAEMTEEHARQFGQYLLRHAEHSVRGTQSGFMPLARVASVNSVGI